MKKILFFLFFTTLFSCSREEHEVHDDNEAITTVKLEFKSLNGSGDDQIYYWRDGSTDPIILKENNNYNLEIEFLNESGTNVKDLTDEVEEEADAHLVIVKTIPNDLISVESMDKDTKGRRLGIKNSLTKVKKGQGSLKIILLHQPPVNGKEVKDGISENIGSTDVDVSFPITIR